MKKLVVLLVVLAAVVAAGIFGARRLAARAPETPAGTLRLHGNVDLRDVALAFFGQERIATVQFEEGARVEPGELLATLHTERLQAEIAAARARVAAEQALVDRLEHGTRPEEIAQARADVAAAEVRVANAERVLARVQATAQSGASSAQDLDDAQAELDTGKAALEVQRQALALALAGPREEDKARARATLAALQGELALLQRRLADSQLFAPSKGVVQTRILEPGEMASPERPVLTLALSDPKWVRAYVPEPQLSRVRNGMRASVRTDGVADRVFQGWVGFVSPVAEFTPKMVETEELRPALVYEVRVFVRDPDGELPLGAPVTVEVDTLGGTDHAPEEGR